MIGDIFWKRSYRLQLLKIESQSKRHMNRQHEVRVIGYIWKNYEDFLTG